MLQPLDYLVVAFLPGISEASKKYMYINVYIFTTGFLLLGKLKTDIALLLRRNFFFGVRCCRFLDSIGRVSWWLLPFLVFYTSEVAGTTPLLSGTYFVPLARLEMLLLFV